MMGVFQPPTDNLYKFMAVSGVVLIVAGMYFPPVFFHQTGMEYLAQLRGSKEFQVHEKFINQRLGTLKLREQEVEKQKNKLEKRLEGLNSASNSTEVDKLEGRIKEANREIESIADSSHELRLNLALKKAQSDYEETVSFNRRRDARVVLLVGWLIAMVGAFFSFIGFRRWYKRLQKFQDRLVAKEAEAKLATTAANEPDKPAQPKPTQDNVTAPAK